MIFTFEARWFDTSPLPDALRTWFHTLGAVETSTQTDWYLPAEDPTLNLKVRDDQLQIKRRLAGPFRRAFGPDAAGRCEQWGKWSLSLQDGPTVWSADPTGLWIRVEKIRHQISIPADRQSSLTETLPTSPPASIELELTTLKADAESAWTFCLETEGPIEGLKDTLTTAGPLLLDDPLPVELPDDQSFGYVRWLQQRPSTSLRPISDVQIPAPE